jgi:hypothetical protein
LGQEIAQKLGIDSSVLRQELRYVAAERSATAVKTSAEAQATDAERILIRALASARQMQSSTEHFSARNGARDVTKDEEFDPARQAQYAFQSEGLHRGMATESLVETLLNAGDATADVDVMDVPQIESDRRLLALILFKEDEELTPELLERAVRALRKIHFKRDMTRVLRELQSEKGQDSVQRNQLLRELERIKRALMDPSLPAEGDDAA